MIIDLHVHTDTYSACSYMTLEEALIAAKEKNLHALCFTEHDIFPDRKLIDFYSKKYNIPLFIGVEIHALEGDILVFGCDTLPYPNIPSQELIHIVNQQNGICIAAHPFRDNAKGVNVLLDQLQGLQGIETYNGNTKTQHNALADIYAKKLNLPAIGGSDAHHKEQVGIFATYFEDNINNMADIVHAIKNNKVQPVAYNNGEFIKIY